MTTTGISNTNANFISVMRAPTNGGLISLNIVSYDSSEDVDLDIDITVSGDETIVELSKLIEETLITELEDYAYAGTPVFSSRTPPSTFRVDRSSHAVSIWSQAPFSITVTENETDAYLDVDQSPSLVTVEFMREFAAIYSLDLTDDESNDFTDEQIGMLIKQFSQGLISKLGHFVVLCTYLNSFRGNDTRSVFLRPTPGYTRDTLYVRQKSRGYIAEDSEEDEDSDSLIPYSRSLFNWIKTTGELVYSQNNSFIDMKSPFKKDNEIQVTVRAGYKEIPKALQIALMRLIALDQSGEGDFKVLAGGSVRLEIDSPGSLAKSIFKSVKPYMSLQ